MPRDIRDFFNRSSAVGAPKSGIAVEPQQTPVSANKTTKKHKPQVPDSPGKAVANKHAANPAETRKSKPSAKRSKQESAPKIGKGTKRDTKPKSKTKVDKEILEEIDDDLEEPIPSKVRQQMATHKHNANARVIISDSDSDIEELQPSDSVSNRGAQSQSKSPTKTKTSKLRRSPRKESKSPEIVPYKSPTKKKAVSPSKPIQQQAAINGRIVPDDFFGATKISDTQTNRSGKRTKQHMNGDDLSLKNQGVSSTHKIPISKSPIKHDSPPPTKRAKASTAYQDVSSVSESTVVFGNEIDSKSTDKIDTETRSDVKHDKMKASVETEKQQQQLTDDSDIVPDSDPDDVVPDSQPTTTTTATKSTTPSKQQQQHNVRRSSPRRKPAEPHSAHNRSFQALELTEKHLPSSSISHKSPPKRRSAADDTSTAPHSGEQGGGSSAKRHPGYYGYINRAGPQALGSKEIPEGAEDCLSGLTFVLTGVLESIDRDETKALIEKYSGRVTTSVSRKTNYVVAGRDAGESKTKKAHDLGVKLLDDDGLFDLIRNRSKGKTVKSNKPEPVVPKKRPEADTDAPTPPTTIAASTTDVSWVDKYKPTSVKHIIGQHGAASAVNKLMAWLRDWHKNRENTGVKKGRGGAWKGDDGSSFRAALLSGPPGIGKTTSAHLCCKELGWLPIEFNASDTRNKKSLEETVKQAVTGSREVDEWLAGAQHLPMQSKRVLIMDEVDGMSGNQDRAGMQELISMIKTSKVPVICVCNDRHSQKVRSLANYCFDLRFMRPRLEQIRGRLLTICAKENFKVKPNTLDQMIEAANHDIRQVIQHLNLLAADGEMLDFDAAHAEAKTAKKDVAVNLFEAARELLSASKPSSSGGNAVFRKAELFFSDYQMMPLFVQENYLRIQPHNAKSPIDRLQRFADAARYLCYGDQCDRLIRSTNNWSLLNEMSMFSGVLPTETLNGHLGGKLEFSTWLGRNSSYNKRQRLLTQLQAHMSMHISSTAQSLQLDYMQPLRDSLSLPLVTRANDGINDVMNIYNHYDLVRDDAEAIVELATFPGRPDPMSKIQTKVKSAFTRAYNKSGRMLPYDNGDLSVGKTTNRKKQRTKATKDDDVSEDMYDEDGRPIERDNGTAASTEDEDTTNED